MARARRSRSCSSRWWCWPAWATAATCWSAASWTPTSAARPIERFVAGVGEGRLQGDVRAARRAEPQGQPGDLVPRRLPAGQPGRGRREDHARDDRPALERRQGPRAGDGHDEGLRHAQGFPYVQSHAASRTPTRVAWTPQLRSLACAKGEEVRRRTRRPKRAPSSPPTASSSNGDPTGRATADPAGRQANRPGARLRRPPRRPPAAPRCASATASSPRVRGLKRGKSIRATIKPGLQRGSPRRRWARAHSAAWPSCWPEVTC